MSYQVIARKWRPLLFEEVVGQDHVVRTLSNALKLGHVGHAYLFSGPKGVGKTTVARILAKSLNCSLGPTPLPCNACEICRGITAGYAVDVLEIDGASNNQVENVRELRESVRFAPAQCRYKVYIIDEVHMLTASAFNALLKTLEEPPPYVVFIFATTEAHKIPSTIHSRCQRLDFKRIPLKKIHAQLSKIILKETIEILDSALYLIAKEAEGSLRDAQSLLDQIISFSEGAVKDEDVIEALGLMDRTVLLDLVESILKKDSKACLNIVEKIDDFGYDLKKVFVLLIEAIRDIIVFKVTGDATLVDVSEAELERLKGFSSSAGLERFELLFNILSRGHEDVSRAEIPRFSFEMTLLKANRAEEFASVAELLERLDGLKRSIGKSSDSPCETLPPIKEEDPVRGFLSDIKEKNDALYKSLESSVITLDGNSLVISANAENAGFLRDVKKDAIAELARAYFKKGVQVEVKKVEGEKSAIGPSGKDSLIKSGINMLGGKIIEEKRRDV